MHLRISLNFLRVRGFIYSDQGTMTHRNSTATRTIRLDSDVDVEIEKIANGQQISANALIGKLLRKYVEWDFLAEKFRFVQNSSQFLEKVFSYLTDEEARELARWAGTALMREFIGFFFKEYNIDTFLKAFKLLGHSAGHFRVEEQSVNGKYTLLCHHGRGQRWSVFYDEVIRVSCKEFFGFVPELDYTENQIVVTIRPEQFKGLPRAVPAAAD